MMQYGDDGTASMRTPVTGSVRSLCTYRDSIRRASVPGGQCRPSVRFFPTSGDDTAAEEEGAYCWSSASSASSPAYASSSGRSSPAVSLSFSDSDLCFSGCGGLHGVEELRAIALQMVRDGYTKGLIRSFSASGGPSPALFGSWFSELDVEWVLLLAREGDKPAAAHLLDLDDGCAALLDMMERWIKALKTMVQVLSITQRDLLATKRPAAIGVRKAISYFVLLATGKKTMAEEREQEEVALFVRFAEASILRMLDFVDTVAAAALNDDLAAAETLPGMVQVYTCVVDDSPAVLALFKEASGGAASVSSDAVNDVFLRKRSKLSDAIWSMMDKVRASFMTDDCWRVSPAEAEDGGVHETTRLMMNYVKLLWRNEGALNLVLQDQHHHFRMFLPDPEDHCSSSVPDLINKMISCSEKQLEKTSNFISDPGLRYIFLMNNCSFISEKVSSLLLPPFEDNKIDRPRGSRERLQPMEDCLNHPDRSTGRGIEMESNLDGLVKIQSFMEAYLDSSWEPIMSCLYHDIPRGFLKCGGALKQFELEFQRTYAVQRTWKVPNAELRKRLRKAVIEKVISGYNQYLTERMARGKNNMPTTNTLLELEELLEELFEG